MEREFRRGQGPAGRAPHRGAVRCPGRRASLRPAVARRCRVPRWRRSRRSALATRCRAGGSMHLGSHHRRARSVEVCRRISFSAHEASRTINASAGLCHDRRGALFGLTAESLETAKHLRPVAATLHARNGERVVERHPLGGRARLQSAMDLVRHASDLQHDWHADATKHVHHMSTEPAATSAAPVAVRGRVQRDCAQGGSGRSGSGSTASARPTVLRRRWTASPPK